MHVTNDVSVLFQHVFCCMHPLQHIGLLMRNLENNQAINQT